LDRLLAGGDRKLTSELLEQMPGLPDHELITGLVDAFIASDPSAALARGAELLATGATVEQALELLTEHLRNLMVVAACGTDCDILDLSEEHFRTVQQQVNHFDAPALVHMIAICDAVSRSARNSSASRALFDAAMVRLAMSQRFADIDSLLSGKALPAASAAPRASQAIVESKKKRAGSRS
jgi:DNA polymerase-3 subunit gamma/tau